VRVKGSGVAVGGGHTIVHLGVGALIRRPGESYGARGGGHCPHVADNGWVGILGSRIEERVDPVVGGVVVFGGEGAGGGVKVDAVAIGGGVGEGVQGGVVHPGGGEGAGGVGVLADV